jgi:hypothetical protein
MRIHLIYDAFLLVTFFTSFDFFNSHNGLLKLILFFMTHIFKNCVDVSLARHFAVATPLNIKNAIKKLLLRLNLILELIKMSLKQVVA